MPPNRLSRPLARSPEIGAARRAFNALLWAVGVLITLSLPAAAADASTPVAAQPPATAASAPAAAQPAAEAVLPIVVAARVTTTAERARLILDLSAPTKFAVVSLEQPPRIAVDVAASALKFDTPPPPAGTGLVTGYTIEQADSGRARAVLTLAGPAQVQQAYVLDAFADQPARLVIDVIPDSPDDFARRVATDAAGAPGAAAPALADNSTAPGASTATPAASAPIVADTTATPAAATPAPAAVAAPAQSTTPTRSAAGPATTAAPAPAATPPQATATPAKAKPLIVLDPGHGGIDSGARAPGGLMEKDIVLAFALKLQKLLVASGRFDVALTRTDDTYLTLEQRVELARQNKADLFISLHADSFSQPQIHGASIYTRDEQATDVLDKVLADNENKLDIVAGFAVPKMTPAVVDALVDLMRRQMRKESFVAAESIIHELQPSIELRRFPVRQADFFVLQAPDVPSMLIELGFMSNTDDIANLTKPDWQDRVADALARGIGAYFDEEAQP